MCSAVGEAASLQYASCGDLQRGCQKKYDGSALSWRWASETHRALLSDACIKEWTAVHSSHSMSDGWKKSQLIADFFPAVKLCFFNSTMQEQILFVVCDCWIFTRWCTEFNNFNCKWDWKSAEHWRTWCRACISNIWKCSRLVFQWIFKMQTFL